MASLSRDANGNYTVQVRCADGKRRSVRLGKVNKKVATEVRIKVEHLNALAVARLPMDGETAAWVGGIGDDLARKLAAAGLIPPRRSAKLGEFLNGYLERRRHELKAGTVTTQRQAVNDLIGFFGADADLRSITEAKGDEFRMHYLTRTPKLAAATSARRLKACRTFFKHAVRLKLIPANPFADLTLPNVLPAERRHYISAEDARRLIAASNPTWRIIIALSRFAGLRCPSEVLSLKWEHVNFETGRMTVPSCKTEHLPGKAYRVVPIFAELRPYLDEAFELAADGAEYVVPGNHRKAALKPGGWNSCNLRTTFEKIVRRAGLQPWPRLFHNLRTSCETDLAAAFPMHVVCGWIGNSPDVARRHYLQTLEADFDRAVRGAISGAVVVQNAVQSRTATNGQQMTNRQKSLENKDAGHPRSPGVRCGPSGQVTLRGFGVAPRRTGRPAPERPAQPTGGPVRAISRRLIPTFSDSLF
jgi:integrase